MKRPVLIILLIIILPVIAYAGEYSTNYNVVLSDENDTPIMRIISIGMGSSKSAGENVEPEEDADQKCPYFQVAFQNLSDRPITIVKRAVAMEYFNYDGEFFLDKDGRYKKDTDIQRNIPVNWEKTILSKQELQYDAFPLCQVENVDEYQLMVLEVHLLWNDQKYFFSLNLPIAGNR